MTEQGETIGVFIVDDHQVVRRGLCAFLDLEQDLRVVGEAADGEQAVDRYGQLWPDVTLLDLHMEPVDGLTALKRIRAMDESARIIVLTSFVDAAHVMPALEAGAQGYLLKTADPEEIAAAVRNAVHGRKTYDPDVMSAVADSLATRAAWQELTDREKDVLKLLASGKSNQEIAQTLYIGLKTVKTHVSHIFAKLNVADRTQAAVFALKSGLVGGDE